MPGTRVTSSGFIRGPAWDVGFLFAGVWLAPLVVLASWWADDGLDRLYLVLSAAFWIGHRVSSALVAYGSPQFRPLLRSQPVRFVWLPLVTVLAVLAFVVPAGAPWPWPRAERIAALVVVDFALLSFHFAAQHFGVLTLYRLRAGAPPAQRRADRWLALGLGGALVVVAELVNGALYFQDRLQERVPDELLALVDVIGAHALPVRVLGTVIAVTATLASMRRRSWQQRAYVVSLGGMVASAFWISPLAFLAVWTVQHWLAAIGLATVVVAVGPSAKRRALTTFAALAFVSVLAFPLFDAERADAWSIVVALGFATGLVHYQLDRAVFRFSHPDVRAAAAALLAPPA